MDQSHILSRGSKWDSYCSMVHQRKPYGREGGGVWSHYRAVRLGGSVGERIPAVMTLTTAIGEPAD